MSDVCSVGHDPNTHARRARCLAHVGSIFNACCHCHCHGERLGRHTVQAVTLLLLLGTGRVAPGLVVCVSFHRRANSSGASCHVKLLGGSPNYCRTSGVPLYFLGRCGAAWPCPSRQAAAVLMSCLEVVCIEPRALPRTTIGRNKRHCWTGAKTRARSSCHSHSGLRHIRR